MRLLLDACLDARDKANLVGAGHDVLSVADCNSSASDDQVLAYAFTTRRVLITLDKDFGALAIRDGRPRCGILRLAGFTSVEEAEACASALRQFKTEHERGALVVFEPDRSRVRDEHLR